MVNVDRGKAVVLFIGSRGSGKTTIADILEHRLCALGYVCLRQHAGLKRKPFLRAFINTFYLWRFFDIKLIKELGFRGRTRRKFISAYRVYMPLAFAHDMHKLHKTENGVLLYDSNILRGLMSAMLRDYSGERRNFLEDLYIHKIHPRAGKLIVAVVDTDPKTSISRWTQRDGILLTDEEYDKAMSDRKEFKLSVDILLNSLRNLNDVHIVRLSGARSPDENADCVARVVDASYIDV